eukprot:TRINITY_DN18359_c0_g1_i1.p1 TRINITY_DN18359_c0_g1~~TRINITY_DN18359_c0_g1_i1.p1  ORF type:complete len:527 (+),score=164.67 TRINITY_DN18359_c0_g1_i1:57-1637(+)
MYHGEEPTLEWVERVVGKNKVYVVLVVVVAVMLCAELQARGLLHDVLPLARGQAVQGGAAGHGTHPPGLVVSSAHALGEVMDLLISVAMVQYFPTLQKAGYTSLHAVANSQSCPAGMKMFHYRLIRREAYRLLLPEGSAEKAPLEEEHMELLPTPKAAVAHAICNSWGNTEGVHHFMNVRQKAPAATFMAVDVPACQGRAKVAARGVLYAEDADAAKANEDDSASGKPGIATVVANDKGWFQNTLTMRDVAALRDRGVLRQLLFDRRHKTVFCGAPKAATDVLHAWTLDGAHLWNARTAGLNASAFAGQLDKHLVTGNYMSDHEVLEALNSGAYFKYTFVRDPFTRTLSTFDDKLYDCTRKRAGKDCRYWMWLLSGARVRRSKAEGFTFREYVKLLQKRRYHELDVDVTYHTAHWLPQTHVCALDHIAYDFVGRTETGDKDMQTLYDLVGRQGMEARKRWLLTPAQRIDSKTHHYGADQATVTTNMEALREVYARDFELLGYKGNELIAQLRRGAEEEATETAVDV